MNGGAATRGEPAEKRADQGAGGSVRSDGGLFDWGFGVGAMLTRSTSSAATDARLTAVEYLLEMVYSLLLDADECVSLSGGFESFLGEYGGKHTVEPETERSEE